MRDEPADAHLLLVVGQLEEIFTLSRSQQQRSALLANICSATSIPAGRVVIVLTLRADFYPMLARYPEFRQLVQNRQLLLGMPDAEGVRQAIEGPAWHVGLEIEPGLVETIVADVGSEPGMLPLLQQALLETWRRRSGRLLALAGCQGAGGVRRALADRAEEIYQGLDPAEQDSARQLFLRLVQPGTATEDTRRRVSRRELGDSSPPQQSVSEHVIPRFVNERLLTADADVAGGERWIEVSHEALIRGWSRLKSWIDSDRSGLWLHRGLTTAAQEWDDRDHDESTLFRGRRLADTVDWTHETQR